MPGKGRKVSWHYCLKKTTGYASGSKETVSMSRKK